LHVRTSAVNRAGLLAIAAASVGAIGCSERTLLQVDITGDRRFDDVVLRLSALPADTSAAPREADFPDARFDTTNAYQAGLYLPAGWSGTVTVAATVIEGACEVAAGSAIARDIRAEERSAVVPILVVSHASCIPVGDGSAGGTGGAGGGAGSGGGSGTGGGSGGRAGAGGAAGTGGGTAGVGAAGGQTGTGGGAGAGGRAGTGGGAGAGGGIAGASGMGGRGGGVGGMGGVGGVGGMGGGVVGGAGGTFGGRGGTVGGAGGRGGAGGTAGPGGTGGAGGCSQSNAAACGVRNCGSAQNICGQVVPCGICGATECCDLGVCGPAGNPPRC
jgi:hypothetical protein